MPPTNIVPSKRVLRALRHLALGTSCTVAVGVGFISEERRRLIHTVQRVNDNAKKLKAARSYHSAGGEAVAQLAEDIIQEGYESASEHPVGRLRRTRHDDESRQTIAKFHQSGSHRRGHYPALRLSNDLRQWKQLDSLAPAQLSASDGDPIQRERPTGPKEDDLAGQVRARLAGGAEAPKVKDAAEFYLRSVADLEPVTPDLVDVAILLTTACRAVDEFQVAGEILESLVSRNALDDAAYQAFDPHAVISGLLRSCRITGTPGARKTIERATSIYLLCPSKVLAQHPHAMGSLGLELLQAAMKHEVYTSAEDIFFQFISYRYGPDASNKPSTRCLPHSAVVQLILADIHLKEFKKASEHFLTFYVSTNPTESELSKTTALVLDAAIESDDWNIVESVLQGAAGLAQDAGLQLPSPLYFKVLDAYARKNGNKLETKSFLHQLQLIVKNDRQIEELGAYFEQLNLPNDSASAATGLKIQERSKIFFTASLVRKALGGEWDGIEQELSQLKDDGHRPDLLEAAFFPAFKIFAKSHSLEESNEFLVYFNTHYGVPITPRMVESIILSSIWTGNHLSALQWIQQEATTQLLTANSFNYILQHCHQLKVHVDRLIRFCSSMCKANKSLLNRETVNILEASAMAWSKGDPRRLERYLFNINQRLGLEVKKPNKRKSVRHMMRGVMAERHASQLSTEKAEAALGVYRRAVAQKQQTGQAAVRSAVEITLRLNGVDDLQPALNLLHTARERGEPTKNALSALYIALLDRAHWRSNQIMEVFHDMVREFRKQDIEPPRDVVTHAMSLLINRGYFQKAMECCWEAWDRQDRVSHHLDLPLLTVLLNAFVGIRDSTGIKWVVGVALHKDVVPDLRFKQSLQRARNRVAREVREAQEVCSELLVTLEESHRLVVERRSLLFSQKAEKRIVQSLTS